MKKILIGIIFIVLCGSAVGILFVDITGDNMTTVENIEHGTNPVEMDTDQDGLTDGEEVNEYNTNPRKEDTDGDGLTDSEEIKTYNTDPTKKDTDGDGLTDGEEINLQQNNSGMQADVDPLQRDIIIEIDTMEQTNVDSDELTTIKESFEEAPIDNPNNSTGINVHFKKGQTVPIETRTEFESYYKEQQYKDHFETDGYGTRHILIVNDARIGDTNVGGATQVSSDVIIVQYYDKKDLTGSTIMHEMGHSLGLDPNTFDGVDNQKYSIEEYPSIMNYNYYTNCETNWKGTETTCNDKTGDELYTYSTGTQGTNDFNDWAHIEENMDRGLNTTKLNT